MSSSPQPQKSGTFGERLRREREMRGIKLEEISESTKIGKRNLVALEEERFDQLPGGIFNKGFVRAYAKFLGLDEEQAVNDFLAASANYEQPAALAPPPRASRDSDAGSPASARNAAVRAALASRPAFSSAGVEESAVKPPAMPSDATVRRRQRLWVLAAALVLVIGLALWFKPAILGLEKFSRRQESAAPAHSAAAPASKSPEQDQSARTVEDHSAQPQAAVPLSKTPNSDTSSAPPSGAGTQAQQTGSPARAEVARDGVEPQAAAPSQAVISTEKGSAAGKLPTKPVVSSYAASPTADSITLSLHATSEVWVSAMSDGVSVLNFTLQPGQTRQLRASNHLILKTGNAAALDVSFNGKPLPPLGKDGQVRTLTFTSSGLR